MVRVRRQPATGSKRAASPQRRRWSDEVTHNSNALDLDAGIFASGSARAIAASLKRSAERSRRRKGTPFQSAMSMLTFYINRAGKHLPAQQRTVLAKAKLELRKAFDRA